MSIIIPREKIQAAQESQQSYAPGIYTVRVIEAEEGENKNKTRFLKVTFETLGELQFKFKHWFYLTDAALSIFLNMLSAAGIDYSSKTDLKVEAGDILGSVLELELVKGEENEEGKSYLQLKPWSCKSIIDKKKSKEEDKIVEDAPF